MAWQPVSFGQGSSRSRHGQEGDARFVNCYLEEVGDGGKAPVAVYASDGLESWATITGGGSVRALLDLDNKLLSVSGRVISEHAEDGTAAAVGGLPTDGVVTMARNRKSPNAQVGIVSDGLFYIYEGGAVTQVNDPDLPAPIGIAAIDGHFVLPISDGRFFITSVDEGTEVDGLDFASAEANPDGLVAAGVRNRDLLLFGGKTTEVWNNTGAADFPFTRTTSIDVGCLAPESIATVDQTVGWIADDGTVRLLSGYAAERISTHAVERSIAAETSGSLIKGWCWQDRGHTHYAIAGDGMTWVYDLTTGLWHERESYGLARWRVSAYARFAGQHIVGDYATGTLYRMRYGLQTEGSADLVMTVQTPTVHGWPRRLKHNAIEVDCVRGTGLVTTTASNLDPVMAVAFSDDGGDNFGPERRLEIGRAGQTNTTLRARRLGREAGKSGRIYRLRISAAVTRGIMGMAVDAEPLSM